MANRIASTATNFVETVKNSEGIVMNFVVIAMPSAEEAANTSAGPSTSTEEAADSMAAAAAKQPRGFGRLLPTGNRQLPAFCAGFYLAKIARM
jgi:hypothetical protein